MASSTPQEPKKEKRSLTLNRPKTPGVKNYSITKQSVSLISSSESEENEPQPGPSNQPVHKVPVQRNLALVEATNSSDEFVSDATNQRRKRRHSMAVRQNDPNKKIFSSSESAIESSDDVVSDSQSDEPAKKLLKLYHNYKTAPPSSEDTSSSDSVWSTDF